MKERVLAKWRSAFWRNGSARSGEMEAPCKGCLRRAAVLPQVSALAVVGCAGDLAWLAGLVKLTASTGWAGVAGLA